MVFLLVLVYLFPELAKLPPAVRQQPPLVAGAGGMASDHLPKGAHTFLLPYHFMPVTLLKTFRRNKLVEFRKSQVRGSVK